MGSVMTKDWVHGVGRSPVCQILSQIVVRAVITSSPPAWTSSTGMLSTPAVFSISAMILLQPPLLCEGWGGHPLCLSGYSSVQMDFHWPCSCTAQSSILSIGSVLLLLFFLKFSSFSLHCSPIQFFFSLFHAPLDVVVIFLVFLRFFRLRSFLSQFSFFLAQIKNFCSDPVFVVVCLFVCLFVFFF